MSGTAVSKLIDARAADFPPAWLAWSSPVHVIWLYPLLLGVSYTIAYTFGVFQVVPNEQTLALWDAGWFRQVAQHGYQYSASSQNDCPFFPLHPLVWRLTGLGFSGISCLNGLVALTSLALLARDQGLRLGATMLLAAVPSAFIWFTPYSEAWFFTFSVVLVMGLRRRRLALVLLGLAGCCVTRSASVLFIPAYVFTVGLMIRDRATAWRALRWLVAGLGTIGLFFGLVILLQWYQTGEWFAFLKAGAQWNDHKFGWPTSLVFYSSAGTPIFWLDSLGFLTGIGSGLAVLITGGWWLLGLIRRQPMPTISPEVCFALGYLFGLTFLAIGYQNGDLMGNNRYVFATPFAMVLLSHGWRYLVTVPKYPLWQLGTLALVALVTAGLLFGFPSRFDNFSPGETALYFGLMIAYALAMLLSQSGPLRRELTAGLVIANMLMQGFVLNLFLQGIWVG